MKKNQYDAGFALNLKVEAVPTLKGHKSELQSVSKTVQYVSVELAFHVGTNFSANIVVRQSGMATKQANGTLC